MSNHCLELSSIFASSKPNPRFSPSKLSSSSFFLRSAKNHRGKSTLGSASSFSIFRPCLNRKGSVTQVINSVPPVSELADTSKAFSPEIVGKRTNLKKIMILVAGPIVIGQACKFDYSGTQACKALREEGYNVILINLNPATFMTDPETANQTYITLMTPKLVEQIIEKERPDALLPIMGGQTALNLDVALAESCALERYGMEFIGAKLDAIKKDEDRDLF